MNISYLVSYLFSSVMILKHNLTVCDRESNYIKAGMMHDHTRMRTYPTHLFSPLQPALLDLDPAPALWGRSRSSCGLRQDHPLPPPLPRAEGKGGGARPHSVGYCWAPFRGSGAMKYMLLLFKNKQLRGTFSFIYLRREISKFIN